MANVNPTAYTDSDTEEEHFPTPRLTPAIAAAVPGDLDHSRPALPPRRQVPVSDDYFHLRPCLPEGRPRSRSPPVLLPVSPFHLADDVEQVRLRAFHGITPSKISKPIDTRYEDIQEGRSFSAPIELQVNRMPDDRMHSQVNRMLDDRPPMNQHLPAPLIFMDIGSLRTELIARALTTGCFSPAEVDVLVNVYSSTPQSRDGFYDEDGMYDFLNRLIHITLEECERVHRASGVYGMSDNEDIARTEPDSSSVDNLILAIDKHTHA